MKFCVPYQDALQNMECLTAFGTSKSPERNRQECWNSKLPVFLSLPVKSGNRLRGRWKNDRGETCSKLD
jgi:hypothetical protein